LIRHGARAQSPPLDIMCLPAARTHTHHFPRTYTLRACACTSVTVPATEMYPLCNRVLSELRYSSRSIVLVADVGTSPNLQRFTLGPHSERKSQRWFLFPHAMHGSRENRRYTVLTVHVSFVSFARFPLGLEARGVRKRARRHGALLTISRDCRSHPRSPPLVCHPTNSLSAFLPRAREAKCVCDACIRSRAHLLHLAQPLIRLLLSLRSRPRRKTPTSKIRHPPSALFFYSCLNIRDAAIVHLSHDHKNYTVFIFAFIAMSYK